MKQVTAAIIGAGQRGAEAYASYALRFPGELKIVAVAEPRAERRALFCAAHHIPPEHSFSTWEELLAQPKLSDCVVVATQDRMHFEPVMSALEKGYHVLCEKPMSPFPGELETMRDTAARYGRILSVGHTLRYSPFFSTLKELLDGGAVGDLVSIQHMEGVGYWHAAHSFVRGNWRRKDETSPMILAKCCHDMDILLWLTGSRCKQVTSFGGLRHFNAGHAPMGAPARCTDGCPHRDACPYYAPRFYLEHAKAKTDNFVSVITTDPSPEGIMAALETGPYGRCVYRCDNDVVDHQIVNLAYENGVVASMTMCAFTETCERTITLMGTRGQIKGNMEENCIQVFDFASGRETILRPRLPVGGHSGSDTLMMREFVALVAAGDGANSRTDAAVSVESHLIALAAEESRLNGGAVIQL